MKDRASDKQLQQASFGKGFIALISVHGIVALCVLAIAMQTQLAVVGA